MRTNQSKYGRRFDEEFKREVAALASRPGATNEQVAQDLGVSQWSVSRWRRADPPTRVNEVWQVDITYIPTQEGWLYLAGVLDAYSRKIVGWAAADAMPTSLVARAFERAVRAERPAPAVTPSFRPRQSVRQRCLP